MDETLKLAKTNEELLKTNKSVQSMINTVTRLESILQGKLELFDECLCENCPVSPCVPSTLTFKLSNPNGGSIIKTNTVNTYMFTGTELPTRITFSNNILMIPNNFDWSKAYTMKFMIGTDDCEYTVTINTVICTILKDTNLIPSDGKAVIVKNSFINYDVDLTQTVVSSVITIVTTPIGLPLSVNGTLPKGVALTENYLSYPSANNLNGKTVIINVGSGSCQEQLVLTFKP